MFLFSPSPSPTSSFLHTDIPTISSRVLLSVDASEEDTILASSESLHVPDVSVSSFVRFPDEDSLVNGEQEVQNECGKENHGSREKNHVSVKENRDLEKYKRISVFWSTQNLTNDILGTASIALGYSISQAGVGLAPILMLLYAYMSFESLLLMQIVCNKFELHTFIDMASLAMGRFGFYLSSAFIFLCNWAAAVGSLMIMGTIAPDLLIQFFGYHPLFDRATVIIIVSILIGPLAYFKNLRRFAFASLVAVILLLFIYFAIIVRCAMSYENLYWSRPNIPAGGLGFSQGGFWSAIGGISYIFTCSDMAIHILRSLDNPTPLRWSYVALFGIFTSMVLGCGYGVACSLLFFGDTSGNVLDNFSRSDVFAIVLRFLLIMQILPSFPFNCFMPRVVLLSLAKLIVPHFVVKLHGNRLNRTIVHFVLTTFVVVSAMITAIFVTNLGAFYSVIGGIGSISISMFIPPACYLLLIGDQPLIKFKCYLLIVFGLLGLFGTLYANFV